VLGCAGFLAQRGREELGTWWQGAAGSAWLRAGGAGQPLAGRWFLLERLCPAQAGTELETGAERGCSEIMASCQSKREKETLSPPRGRVAGGKELLWLARGGRRPPCFLRAGTTWDLTGGMCFLA